MTEETIFTNALAKSDAKERQAYLDEACGDNLPLRREVEALLATHDADSGFLVRPAVEQLAGNSSSAGPPTEALASSSSVSPQPKQAASSETQAEEKPAADVDLAFLAPSAHSGHLGRLGHYEVQEVIGKGGFGIVLKAFDERLHRVVAIKVLSPAFAANASARRRFIREARAAAAVKNEHVVGIYDVQEDANPPFLVMELIDGVSLQQKIDQTGPLGVIEILRIGVQIAEGLAAAHKQGKVHRDIKPANILLENGVERVKITDFGLARAVDDTSVTQSGIIAGTPMYMSPEQAEGLTIDHRSDLFSLGTVLYAMCTGDPPFRATGTVAVLKRVVEEIPRPIREINSEIPDWLEAIVATLHAKNPEDRFQTAKEVAELLGQHLAHVQQPGQSPKPPLELTRPPIGTRPRRLRSRLKAVALFVVLVALGFLVLPWLRSFVLNTARVWINGDARATLKLVRVQDGDVVEQGNIAWLGRGLPAGDYMLEAEYDRSRWSCEFLLKSGYPLMGIATAQKADRLNFSVGRGDYVTVNLTLIAREIEIRELPTAAPGPDSFAVIDLIPHARPEWDRNTWKREGNTLFCPEYPTFVSFVPFDVKLPREYEIEAVIERVSGTEFIAFHMSAFDKWFKTVLDAKPYEGGMGGLGPIEGKPPHEGPAAIKGMLLTSGVKHTARWSVQAGGIQMTLDGKTLIDYQGGYAKLDGPTGKNGWPLFVEAHNKASYRIHRLRLTPVQATSR
jgi:hypothetical protein